MAFLLHLFSCKLWLASLPMWRKSIPTVWFCHHQLSPWAFVFRVMFSWGFLPHLCIWKESSWQHRVPLESSLFLTFFCKGSFECMTNFLLTKYESILCPDEHNGFLCGRICALHSALLSCLFSQGFTLWVLLFFPPLLTFPVLTTVLSVRLQVFWNVSSVQV